MIFSFIPPLLIWQEIITGCEKSQLALNEHGGGIGIPGLLESIRYGLFMRYTNDPLLKSTSFTPLTQESKRVPISCLEMPLFRSERLCRGQIYLDWPILNW